MVVKDAEKYAWVIGVLIALVTFAIALIFFAIVPSFKGIKKVEADIKDRKAELSLVEEKLGKLKELKTREAELKEKEAVVNKAIPTKKEIGDLFIQLEGIINETGGSSSGISEGGDQALSNGSTDAATVSNVSTSHYGYSVNFPDYKNFKKFLERSENALRFISLDNFSVSKSVGSFEITLSYKTYYRNQAEKTAAVGEGQPPK